MRILFTTNPFAGHYQPLVPIARAAADAGHEVAVACPASFVPVVEALGFRAFPAGYDLRGRTPFDLFPGLRRQPTAQSVAWVVPHVFVGVFATMMAPDLLSLATDWPPDLIVREGAEYGGRVAAEVLGIPHASVRAGYQPYEWLRLRLGAALDRLRELNGLPPDPEVAMLYRYLHLAAEPPGFPLPNEEPIPTAHLLRPVNVEAGDEALPEWVRTLPDRPTVYVTLGTVYSRRPDGQALFGVLLEALGDEPLNVVVTVGRDNDPAQWGPQPDHVHVTRFIPQSQLLPHCDLVVTHGGFGTVTGSLNAGLPLVLLPLSADQPYNAACRAHLGVGVDVPPEERTVEVIRAAVREVLGNPTCRQNAERVRDEMAALPGPEQAVQLLERLAEERRLIPAA